MAHSLFHGTREDALGKQNLNWFLLCKSELARENKVTRMFHADVHRSRNESFKWKKAMDACSLIFNSGIFSSYISVINFWFDLLRSEKNVLYGFNPFKCAKTCLIAYDMIYLDEVYECIFCYCWIWGYWLVG